jgi:hypothetical protein
MNPPTEPGINGVVYPIVGVCILLFAVLKGFFTCRGYWLEIREARKAKAKAALDALNAAAAERVSGERAVSDTLSRVDAAQDAENRLLDAQLNRQQVIIKGHEFTIERQVRALVDCWQGHPNSRHHVDVLLELEKGLQRQDQLDAKVELLKAAIAEGKKDGDAP